MRRNDPYKALRGKVTAVIDETPNIKTFRVETEEPFSFMAGQFVEFMIPGVGEAPFTPSSAPSVKEYIELTIMKAGRITSRIHQLKEGDEVGIRGPLGVPYPLDAFRGREVLVVGGGVGLAPLRALLFALFEEMNAYRRVILRYGAKSPSDIVYRDAVLKGWGRDDLDVMVTVDAAAEGWDGPVGVVTTILEGDNLQCDPAEGVAVVCGPPIMMKFTTLKLLEMGYSKDRIYLSMEKSMSCGLGKCGRCRIGPYYACKDGPVFTYDKVEPYPNIWD